jgi:hypothetical protein
VILFQAPAPPSWEQILIGLGVLVLVAAFVYVNWRRGSDKAGDRALDKWKNLAEATEAENKRLRTENAELTAINEAQARDLKICDDFRNEVAQEFLRGAARERRYQQCINRLEMVSHLPVTDFNDPTVHITESTHR